MSFFVVGCGGIDSQEPSELLGTQEAPLTETDVDVAPECQGIIDFLNVASFQTLDQYLPSDVASNLVGYRALSPFATLADVSSVPLVGSARLEQIEGGARSEGYIGASCVGIIDELAVSADDASRMVSLVNSVSSTELHDILPYAWNGAVNLLNLRPFTTVESIAATAGIGSVSLRNLRNAATLSDPLEDLIAAVNALPQPDFGAIMARHFDRYELTTGSQYYSMQGLECFGIDPDSLPYGTSIRSNLADAAEVRAEVEATVDYANRYDQLPPSVVAQGLANLDARITGRSFKGCYFSYAHDPWSGNNVAFFVDTVSGFSVLTESYWSE
ncbi:helix-hairpin-helix domain-containing protein [Polyangium fumosum]|nr:helix-hairpin-helix domain-containing protein [Polyangium fumosum]